MNSNTIAHSHTSYSYGNGTNGAREWQERRCKWHEKPHREIARNEQRTRAKRDRQRALTAQFTGHDDGDILFAV